MKKWVCGAFPSDKTGVEVAKVKTHHKLPEEYDTCKYLLPVIDQGNRGICASVSMTDVLSFTRKFHKFGDLPPRDIFYLCRSDKSKDGMTIRECLNQAKERNFIKSFALVNTPEIARNCLVMHSPLIIGLPVYNFDTYFWRKSGKLIGGHAVVLCGYNKEGFILKNSWGNSYGNGGYITIPYSDWPFVLECWTVLS